MNSRRYALLLLVAGCSLLSACGGVPKTDDDNLGNTGARMRSASLTRTFVFVKINESVMPIERGRKYEHPLDDALKHAQLGEVTGGGSMLSTDRAIEWVGIDIELIDLDAGLPFLKRKLVELDVPDGSTLEYRLQDRTVTVPIRGTGE